MVVAAMIGRGPVLVPRAMGMAGGCPVLVTMLTVRSPVMQGRQRGRFMVDETIAFHTDHGLDKGGRGEKERKGCCETTNTIHPYQ